ncbi:MAG: hypothetical protein ACXQS8_09390 [Candidatus Helarchaeales archaeon]
MKNEYKEKILKMGLLHAKDFEEAIKMLDDKRDRSVYILPKGINILPILHE